MENRIFRTSFTTLKFWSQGDPQSAINCMFHLPTFENKAMKQGSELHLKASNIAKETGHMPIDLGGMKLKDCIRLPEKNTQPPIIEKKLEVMLLPWLKIVFIADLLSGPLITDYKFGVKESHEYLGSGQIEFYGMGLTAAKYLVKMGRYCHVNQHNGTKDNSYIHITDKTITEAYNWTIKNSREMFAYLLDNKVYEQFEELEETYDE